VLCSGALARGFDGGVSCQHAEDAALAIAGSHAAKRAEATTAGTLPTHGPLFVSLLVGVVLLVGALTFVPALALGPVVEHLQMVGR
jgi:K+-transporting ATPase ATPase A chain